MFATGELSERACHQYNRSTTGLVIVISLWGGLSGYELWLAFVDEVEFNEGARGQPVGGELGIPCVAVARLSCDR